MDSLKELQNAGRIGALGLGQVNIDKLQSHLNQRTMSPAGAETRCFRPTNSSDKKLEIDRSTNMPQPVDNSAFFAMHYGTFAGRNGYPQMSGKTEHRKQKQVPVQTQQQIFYGPDPHRLPKQQVTAHKTGTALTKKQQASLKINEEHQTLSESQETERYMPNQLEASLRNKKLLEQAKKDIASINQKAAEFKTKLQCVKLQISGAKHRAPSSITNQSMSMTLHDETKSTVVL